MPHSQPPPSCAPHYPLSSHRFISTVGEAQPGSGLFGLIKRTHFSLATPTTSQWHITDQGAEQGGCVTCLSSGNHEAGQRCESGGLALGSVLLTVVSLCDGCMWNDLQQTSTRTAPVLQEPRSWSTLCVSTRTAPRTGHVALGLTALSLSFLSEGSNLNSTY